jgi:hypothetical protein
LSVTPRLEVLAESTGEGAAPVACVVGPEDDDDGRDGVALVAPQAAPITMTAPTTTHDLT